MKNKGKYKGIKVGFVFFLLLTCEVQAQEATVSAGGEALGTGGTVSYSIGQMILTSEGTNGSVSLGVQQTFEISTILGAELSHINLEVAAYPNPTTDFLTLTITDLSLTRYSSLKLQVYNLEGKIVKDETISSTSTTIDMSDLGISVYLLQVRDKQKILKTFRILKK